VVVALDLPLHSNRTCSSHRGVSLLADIGDEERGEAGEYRDTSGDRALPTGFLSKATSGQNSNSSSVMRQSDLDLIASNLQRVYIPSSPAASSGSASDTSKRKLDEEMSSRTRSRAANHSIDDNDESAKSAKKSNGSNLASGHGISHRRRMVIECKSLRSQVCKPTSNS